MAQLLIAATIAIFAFAAAYAGDVNVPAAKARAAAPVRARPVSVDAITAPLAAWGADLSSLWSQAAAADASKGADSTVCRASMLQYEFSLRLQPERIPLRDVFDALELGTLCALTPPRSPPDTSYFTPYTLAMFAAACQSGPFFVNATGGDDSSDGSKASPFATLARALSATRASRLAPGDVACIALRGGVHFLDATLNLGAADSGLLVAGYAGDAPVADIPAWVSGGVPLGLLTWTPYNTSGSMNVWVADVAAQVSAMPGLNVLSASGEMPARLWRAMYPNFDLEQFAGHLPGEKEVVEWVKPGMFDIPTLYYRDLKAEGLKADSTMREYNIVGLGSGAGSVCAHWDNPPDEWAYVCRCESCGVL